MDSYNMEINPNLPNRSSNSIGNNSIGNTNDLHDELQTNPSKPQSIPIPQPVAQESLKIDDPKERNLGGGAFINVNSQAKTFMAGGFTLFFALILVLFAIRPTIADIIRIKRQLKVYQQLAIQLDDKIDTIYNLTNTFDRNKATLAYFDIYYPKNLDYSLFVANLEYICKELGTKLIGVSYSAASGRKFSKDFAKRGINAVEPVVFSITIEGDYNQLVAFLKRIEQTPFLPEVFSMTYQAATPEKKQVFTINVLLFRLKTPITKTNRDVYEYLTGIQ